MSVHYKFKNTINYDAVKFDGVYISANDLKTIIVQQKKLGHSELQVENEETGQLYTDDQLIPKNTNVIVSRLPSANPSKKSRIAANQPYPTRFSGNANGGVPQANGNSGGGIGHHKSHHHHNNHHRHPSSNTYNSSSSSSTTTSATTTASNSAITSNSSTSRDNNSNGFNGAYREAMELVSTKDMSEEEKIKYIQSQSTKDFDPSRYARGGRGGGHGGMNRNYHHRPPGPGYICRKCNIPGHSIHDCKSSNLHKVKRSSGIPRAFLKKVDSKEKGALMTPTGEYAVPYIDLEAYNNPKVEKAPFFEDGVPSDSV